MFKSMSMASNDELKTILEKLEISASDIESEAIELFRSASLKDTSDRDLDPTPYPPFKWIRPFNDSWKRLQRDVIRKYQEWYSTAHECIKIHNPDRLKEFERFYGDHPASEFYGVIDALHLNIWAWDDNAAEIVDEYMDWFGRQRNILLSILSLAEAQETAHTRSPNPVDSVRNLCDRFQLVARQLRQSRKDHESLDIKDEYDVQYLFHALLHLHFDDIRAEEAVPTYAGSSTIMDFLLKHEQIGVETKRSRRGLDARKLGSELSEDIVRYRAHPDCKVLICFVYDPEGLIANPRGIERDLNQLSTDDISVQVFIRP